MCSKYIIIIIYTEDIFLKEGYENLEILWVSIGIYICPQIHVWEIGEMEDPQSMSVVGRWGVRIGSWSPWNEW